MKSTIACIITVFTFMSSPQSEAVVVAEVSHIAQDFESTKKSLEEADLKQRQVLSALYQINKKVKKIVVEKGALSQQRVLLEMNIKNLAQKVETLSAQAKTQKAMLAERLRAIYKLGGQSMMRLIFSSTSSANMERNLKILGIVAKQDLDLIKNYSRDLRDLQAKKKALAQRLESLKSVEQKIAKQESSLLKEQGIKNRILDGTRRNRLFAINKMNDLRAMSLKFNIDDSGLFDLLFKPSFADQKGALPQPAEGPIVKKFGLIKGQEHLYTLNHKGVVISTSVDAPVKAVFQGKVAFAGHIPGYGKTLVIDHGDHYYSVYGYADDLKVAVGDEVTQAQVIAKAGTPTVESAGGLYFEIRHFSEPYDPQQWMKGL